MCIHLDYESRRLEFRAPQLATPTYFQKPTTALKSHRGALLRPVGHKLNYEGGVAVIVGKPMEGKNTRPMNVGDVVEVEVDGLGRLSNGVLEAPAPVHSIGHQPADTDSVRRVALGSDFVRTEAR